MTTSKTLDHDLRSSDLFFGDCCCGQPVGRNDDCERCLLVGVIKQQKHALEAIVMHQETMGGSMAKYSTTKLIAERALRAERQTIGHAKSTGIGIDSPYF